MSRAKANAAGPCFTIDHTGELAITDAAPVQTQPGLFEAPAPSATPARPVEAPAVAPVEGDPFGITPGQSLIFDADHTIVRSTTTDTTDGTMFAVTDTSHYSFTY